MKGGLKHLVSWMVSLDIYVSFSLLFSRKFYYFLLDVDGKVKRRMKWIGEWRTMTYEKGWIKRVEWVVGRRG